MNRNYLILIALTLFNVIYSYSQSDLCESATVIDLSASGGCVSGSTTNATSSLTTNGCTPDPVNEVWYTYTVEGTQDTYDLTSSGIEDAVITINSGGCGSGSYDYCEATTGTGSISSTYAFQPGDQVWISVASTSGTEGDFQLCVTSTTTTTGTPGENSCNPISQCTEQSLNISSYGSASGTKASCFMGPGSNSTEDVWISFCVEESGIITWTGNPSSNSTEFDWSMWDITDGCPGTEVACNYDWNTETGVNFGMEDGNTTAGDDFNDAFDGVAGRCYAIQIVNWSIDGTGFSFSGIDDDCGTCAKISPGVDFSISQTDQCSPPVTVSFGTGAGHDGTVDWDFGNGNTSSESGTPANQTYTDAGTYAITASAGSGSCYEQQTEYVTVYNPLTATATDFCNGANDGEISVFPSGGDGNYTYSWSPNVSSGPTATGLAEGTYDITISEGACGGSTTLSVTLTDCILKFFDFSFDAKNNNNIVDLTWRIEDDILIDYYEINKSTDNNNFMKLDHIISQKDLKSYKTTDFSPSNGDNYYQLIAYDLEGNVVFSDVKSVQISGKQNSYFVVPNPASQIINITCNSFNEEVSEIKIYDVVGKLTHESTQTFEKGLNTTTIDASSFMPGVYILSISGNAGTETIKFMKE